MKYAECTCRDCKLEFKVSFNNGYPKLIHCPRCTSTFIKLNWIDRAGSNEMMDDEKS